MTARLALVAHDARKNALVAWAKTNATMLKEFQLFATGTTGSRLQSDVGLTVSLLLSGPLGGDAQLGAKIAERQLDGLIFFIDPMTALPHDVDVKSLLRLAILYDTPLAVNETTANAVLCRLVKENKT